MSRPHRLVSDARGAAAVEFALVAPVLLAMLVGGIDVSSLVLASLKVTNAAGDVSELVAAQSSVGASSISNFCTAANLDMTPQPTSTLQVGIASVTEGAGGALVDWQTGCNGATGVSNAAALASGVIPNPGDSVIVVQATYQLAIPTPLIVPPSVTITETALYKPRDNTTVTYTG